MQLQKISLDGTAATPTSLQADPTLTIRQQNAAWLATAVSVSDENHAAVLGDNLDAEDLQDAVLNAFVFNGVVLKTNLPTR